MSETSIPLEGTEWVLASLQSQPVVPGTQISLCFERDWFSSFGGCNTAEESVVYRDVLLENEEIPDHQGGDHQGHANCLARWREMW